ncbi:MAG: hypothetical protein AB9869_24295 [Verrucomicrobiia bacterium]
MHPEIETIGFLPYSDPFKRKVRRCFRKAGFKRIKLELNKDRSMMTFWLGRATHPALRTSRQAHAMLRRILRAAGISLTLDDMSVSFRGDTLFGAFTPPGWQANPPD